MHQGDGYGGLLVVRSLGARISPTDEEFQSLTIKEGVLPPRGESVAGALSAGR